MKIKIWIVCVQDRGKQKVVVERSKSVNQEVQRLEQEEEGEKEGEEDEEGKGEREKEEVEE